LLKKREERRRVRRAQRAVDLQSQIAHDEEQLQFQRETDREARANRRARQALADSERQALQALEFSRRENSERQAREEFEDSERRIREQIEDASIERRRLRAHAKPTQPLLLAPICAFSLELLPSLPILEPTQVSVTPIVIEEAIPPSAPEFASSSAIVAMTSTAAPESVCDPARPASLIAFHPELEENSENYTSQKTPNKSNAAPQFALLRHDFIAKSDLNPRLILPLKGLYSFNTEEPMLPQSSANSLAGMPAKPRENLISHQALLATCN
jgi:hypothetical protein